MELFFVTPFVTFATPSEEDTHGTISREWAPHKYQRR